VSSLSGIDIEINTMPVIRGTIKLAEFFGHKLATGFGSETAGGILVFMNPSNVDSFHEYLADKGLPCWTVGKIVKSKESPCAYLTQDIQLIESEFP
jgi:selenide,water dikinase